VLAAAGLTARAQINGYPLISSYSSTETGRNALSFDSAQDDRGIMYFAGTGVLTFDGDHWKSVTIPESFAIRCLSFGPHGRRLWAGAMGDLGWFEQTSPSEWNFHSLRGKLPDDFEVGDVWAVAPDNEGTTFVCRDRILRWNGERFLSWVKPTGKRLFPVRSNSELFVHQVEEGLFLVHPDGPRKIIDREILGDAAVMWVERRGSELLIGTSNGFFAVKGQERVSFAPAISGFLEQGRLSSAVRLRDGRLAVGTLNCGIALLREDGSLDYFLDDHEGLPSPHINSLFVGRDGELWATTGSHIVRIDVQSPSTIFDERVGLPRQTYRQITAANGHICVANESGVYELAATGDRFDPIEALTGRWQEIRGTPRGFLASGFKSATLWDGHEATLLHEAKGDVFASAPSRSVPDTFLVSDSHSVVRVSPDGSSQVLVRDVADTPSSLVEDTSGRIWIGTLARGLFVATPAAANPVEAQSATNSFGLPKLVGPTHVRTNSSGTLFVFANNGAWYKESVAPNFTAVTHFPLRGIAAVSEVAADGTVWVAHESTETDPPCVGRVSLAAREAIWQAHAVDGLIEIGSPRSIYADAAVPDATVLWIGGTHAVLRNVVGSTLFTPAPRAPLLRAFARKAPGQSAEPILAPLRYPAGLIEFQFAAPEFSRRSLLRIETRIDGAEQEWSGVAPGSRRELTAIRDGHFAVKARVVAETGMVSEETGFSFEVLPPWWRTTPALVASVLAAAALLLGAYRLRLRTLRRRTVILEKKIRERTEQLERANAAKTQFVANMSHDIRNPLNGIVGMALALEDTRLDAHQREIVATLRECTTYLSSLVDDVLDFASIEAGRVELRPRVFVPEELLRSIAATLRADTAASGAALSIEVAPDVPPNLVGDAGRVQQILVNFVSNALKYAGGNITLSASMPPDSPEEVEFAVTDQGAGIDAAKLGALFTKFSRLHQTRGGEEIPGTGLGLAACRLLADFMGGSVGVNSSSGCGARFFLRLPLEIGAPPTLTPTAPLPNTTVLLVEDTDYNAWAATAVLSRLGLTSERARTGAEALRLFGERRFNVVLLDRNLPDMDGTDVARRLRAMEPNGRQAVVLAVTAYCTAEDRELCLRSGMDAFVGKPLTPEKLRKVLLTASRRLLSTPSIQVPPEPAANRTPDLSLLSYLSDGSPQGVNAQIQRFVATLEEAESQLVAMLLAGDFTGLAVAAHGLLGHARMIGSAALADASTQLETEARRGAASACEVSSHRVREEIQTLTEAMRLHHPAAPSA
jgi:signal transduction histidine kinase/CheY-like chemotaxis protein/HPt (histidine-containing phosphotransfer) domain-containing protein